ncbi:cation diffusion facilitator family transporter [Methylosinus sp. Sm6]|uniref:cation diffusion facilitator family transporter n=1 Tax=Methylosinus sp. Sm6 TaxID=2866948 RepID=UPI001C98E7DA|nr:cation diffusion facilitator family transporter [Methylosinus sp. Sm6]MBY6240782.1 cation-efflux pump [Methylosinus sp. Sm6]
MPDTALPRHDVAARKAAAAKASIAASAALTIAKLAAGIWSGSLALISEAGHSAADVAATILTYYAVRQAEKPADEKHHYGHAKVESLAALIETGLLFGLALIVAVQAAQRLQGGEVAIDAGWPAFAALGASIVVDFFRSRQLDAVARETQSDALAADALHFASDLVSSALVVVGLLATRAGFPQGDALAAFGVAAFIAVAGWRLGRRTVASLLDAAPQEIVPRIDAILRATPGVIAVERLRLRMAGPKVMGEAVIGVSRTLPLERAARIKDDAAAAIMREFPGAQITLAAHPIALDDETVLERILLVAARRRLQVHHIIAQQIGERLSITLDLELEGAMPQGRAHAIATSLEQAILEEFGPAVEIETHMEPLEPHPLLGRDAEPQTRERLEEALARHAARFGTLTDIHDVRVRETAEGLVVNYHCYVDPRLPVEAVHAAVDETERAMRAEFPDILRIAGHAEVDDHA